MLQWSSDAVVVVVMAVICDNSYGDNGIHVIR